MSRKKRGHKIPRAGKKKNILEDKKFEGILDVNRRGVGFVIVEQLDADIMVRPENLRFGIKGDRVEVVLTRVSKPKKYEGSITKIIERKQTQFIGHLQIQEDFGFFVADHQSLPFDIFIPKKAFHGAKNGERVRVEVTKFSEEKKNPEGKVVALLGHYSDNDLTMEEILLQEGFPLTFSEEALKEAASYKVDIEQALSQGRKDCRTYPTCTIDPQQAKDFDDALSLRYLKNGKIEVGVHIADVSHFVPLNSTLDHEAYERGCSVYLPDRVLPMLPEVISNNLCSLRPQEDKLAFSILFQLDEQAKVHQYWIGETIIRSDYKYAYEDVQQIIDDHNSSEYPEVYQLYQLSQELRKKRFEEGAINFSSQEVVFKLDDDAKPIGIEIKENLPAHQLIEEFMLLANKTIAENIHKKKINEQPIAFPYRVHDLPNEEKVAHFSQFIKRFGYEMNISTPEMTSKTFNHLLSQLKGQPEQHLLETLGIRTMAKAAYDTHNIGHYGLGFENYCHFTSPIRRYPDIMVHRIMKDSLSNELKQDANMERKCMHSSLQEKKAMDAERAALKYKQVEYMQEFLGEELEAIISGVAAFGFWAETVDQKCEGFISISDILPDDEYEMIDSLYALRGRYHGKMFQIGDHVKIQVVNTNLEKRQIDFALIES